MCRNRKTEGRSASASSAEIESKQISTRGPSLHDDRQRSIFTPIPERSLALWTVAHDSSVPASTVVRPAASDAAAAERISSAVSTATSSTSSARSDRAAMRVSAFPESETSSCRRFAVLCAGQGAGSAPYDERNSRFVGR
jgi:hypothetical protein